MSVKFTDETIMPFGKYQNSPMIKVPVDWLMWFHSENKGKILYGHYKSVFKYIEENWDVLETEEAKQESNRIVRKMLSYS